MQSKRNYWHQIWTFCRKRMLPIIMLVIFVISFWFVEKSDVQQIGRLADETLSFLETVCQRYDGYASGQTATRLKDVYDKNQGVRTFATSQELVDREYLQRFIQSQGLTGIVVTDADAMPVAWAETDGTDASDLWQQFLQNENRKNIIEYPNKVYNGNVNIRNVSYDVTIVSRNDSEGLILCYSRAETASTDIYEASLAQTMTNNTFHKNPDIVISDTQGILATNVSELGDSEFLGFRDTNNRDMSGLIKIHMGTKVWYGKCQVFGKYYIYVFYQRNEVFSNTRSVMFGLIAIYVVLCMVILLMQHHSEKKHLAEEHKQLSTIAAISELYATIAIFHMQKGTVEAVTANPSMQKILDQTTELKTACMEFADQIIAPEYREAYKTYLDPATMPERLRRNGTLADIFMDAEGIWYSAFLIPMEYTADGSLKDVLFACRNINAYMKKEERYKEQLKKTALDAEIANAAKSSFLRRMSHDIRTPVNGILGMAALAQDSVSDAQGKTADYIRKITVSANYLKDLMDDVLRMSKLESGKIIFEERAFDQSVVIHETLEFMEERAKKKGITIKTDLSKLKHMHVIGSPLHYRQVVQNIISNAIKFNRPGGDIAVVFREYPGEKDSIIVEFSCSDTGYGMSDEFQKHVFEPFVQEEDSARTTYEGSGLGLAVTKQIVEQNGSSISFLSKKGKGTLFAITIPLRVDSSCRETEDVEETKPSIGGVRILLVEDNELNLEVARSLLENEGAVITEARNGKEAVAVFEQSEPGSFDVILMDIMMPEMDGLEAARCIRKLSKSDASTIPIFAMTANAFVEDSRRSREAGMNEHFVKPLDIESLTVAIYQYCVNEKKDKDMTDSHM